MAEVMKPAGKLQAKLVSGGKSKVKCEPADSPSLSNVVTIQNDSSLSLDSESADLGKVIVMMQ